MFITPPPTHPNPMLTTHFLNADTHSSKNGKMLVDIGLGPDLDFCMDVDRFGGLPLFCPIMEAFTFCVVEPEAWQSSDPADQPKIQTGYPRPQLEVIKARSPKSE
jgi:hypothetical protein